MLFSSPAFILAYLPAVFFGYFGLTRLRLTAAARVWLALASLFFYGWWDVSYVPLLLASIAFNYGIGISLAKRPSRKMLVFGIASDLALLGYFKYAAFFAANINQLTNAELSIQQVVLPLGISFYTFTQIAFLVDAYRGKVLERDPINYILFVTFFPHLIAGPILHHAEMMPQFASRWNWVVRNSNVIKGLIIFAIGLFKKAILADTFAIWADQGFSSQTQLDFFSAWSTSLSYTFQLYFDFSGYCDMAIGAALQFNIRLPINFNSPYKALDIQDFWRRWHITLSRWLRDYLYIPLGGNRVGEIHVCFNLFATFLLGGLWHGASWMFVIWGALHGAAIVIHRTWSRMGLRMPAALAWFITFMFVNVTWVFFRAPDLDSALRVLGGMVDVSGQGAVNVAKFSWAGGTLGDSLLRVLPTGLAVNLLPFGMILIGFLLIAMRNSQEISSEKVSLPRVAVAATMMACGVLTSITSTSTHFLYYQF